MSVVHTQAVWREARGWKEKMNSRQSVPRVWGISSVQNFDLQGYGADYSGSLALGKSGSGGGRRVCGWVEVCDNGVEVILSVDFIPGDGGVMKGPTPSQPTNASLLSRIVSTYILSFSLFLYAPRYSPSL